MELYTSKLVIRIIKHPSIAIRGLKEIVALDFVSLCFNESWGFV